MFRKRLCKNVWARGGALVLSVALVTTNVTMVAPGTTVYAEDGTDEATSDSSSEDSSDTSSDSSEEISTDTTDNTEETVTEETEDTTESSDTTDTDSSESDSATTSSGQDSEDAVDTDSTLNSDGDTTETSSESSNSSNSADSAESDTSSSAISVAADASSEASSEEDATDSTSDRIFDDSLIDVWDFGAEDFGSDYNNRLDEDTINGFYGEDVTAGSTGINLASFSIDDGDFVFNDGGYSTTHRLRSTNTNITRYDNKALKDSNGEYEYTGYIYSNKASSSDVYIALDCDPDDIITAYVASNGTDSEVHFENMEDSTDSDYMTHTAGSSVATEMVFYPSEDATYKLYSATEKLVVARVMRDHAEYATLSGSVSGFTGTGSFDIVFTNEQNGNEVRATVSNGTYTATLAEGFDYTLSLEGADTYVITSDKAVNISGDTTMDMTVEEVALANVTGTITGIDADDVSNFVEKAEFTFTPADENSVYVPAIEMTESDSTIDFSVKLQADVDYTVTVSGVDDYTLVTDTLNYSADAENQTIEFVSKDTTKVDLSIDCDGLTLSDLADSTFTFVLLDPDNEYADTDYTYSFTGQDAIDGNIALREGQYRVEVTDVPDGYEFDEDHSKDAIMDSDHYTTSDETSYLELEVPFDSTAADSAVTYAETITVGTGKDYETISDAIEAIRNMDRTEDQRVTVEIEPGDYQEMLLIDTPNVTLKNATADGSIVPTNSGVSISEDSVRITSYYGHGYTYYSMGSDCKYDAELLEVNNYNGYASFTNPGSGTTSGSYWNATVVVDAEGFEAYDIIFENSFNQYQSELAAEDTIEAQSSAKEGTVARANLEAGSTAVQDKTYVERAAAMAMTATATETYFDHCAFIGRQDTLYGTEGSTEAYYDCDIYGGTDYIFGGMTAVFAKCNLVMNTSENNNDVSYITAAQQKSSSSRGYLMYNCTITSTEPGVNTASTYASKPGYFGRPWQANTSEVVYFDTVIDATCDQYTSTSASLILPVGWNSTLGGTTLRNVEYGTYEVSGVDNSSSRAEWAPVSTDAVTTDGETIAVSTFLGTWDPFTENGDDMTIEFPDGTTQDAPTVEETTEDTTEEAEETTEFTFEASSLTAFVKGDKADGDTETAGTDNYFTLIYSSSSKVDSSTKTWADEYTSSQRVNFGGAVSTEKNAIKFTTSADNATVKIWWAAGDADRQMTILDSTGTAVDTTTESSVKNESYLSTLTAGTAGTYYLGGTANNYIFKVEVTDGEQEEVVRADWSSVSNPVIESVALNSEDANTVDVTVSSLIGTDGGDSLVVTMYDADGTAQATSKSVAEKSSFTFSFEPEVSGSYYFVATLSRDDEETTKDSEQSTAIDFVLPLTAPQFKNAVNKGAGTVKVKFYSVSEAESYTLTATDTTAEVITATVTPDEVVTNTSTEYSYTFTDLTVGHTYDLTLVAVRGTDTSDASTMNVEVTEASEQEWTFSAFGQGVSSGSSNVGYTVNDDDSVTVWDLNNKGKLVPASTDGLSFYYATIPADQNFTLTATATVDQWKFTNGQEGFGLMACDRVGVNGDSSVFWNNSYMASGTKVEYYYDQATGEATTDTSAAKITMKLGLGAQEKVGVTTDNLSLLEANDTTTVTNDFSSNMYTLETSCGEYGAGTYNIWANQSGGTTNDVDNLMTTVRLRIQKNNTGYFVSYLDEDDNVITTKKFYDTEALEQIDSDNVYVGFFTSRTFKVTFSDIELTLVDPADDEEAEDQPTTYVEPSYEVVSASYSNTADYELRYTGNADGVLTIADADGNVLVDNETVSADDVKCVDTTLVKGDNKFTITFTPDADYHPENDEYQLLSSYESSTFTHTVTYKTINDDEEIYVTPDGTSSAAGTEADPVDIYTAVKYVQPGQTIRLAGGTYSLTSTVTVARGIDGTSSQPIKMIADSDDRAVFDFGGKCAGFIFAGDYWYVSGIDCTNSGNSLKGIQLSGSHCTMNDIHTYENGNTGLQVSRYLSTDTWDDWPSYDLILNCTSYSNADAGYEDADGFAAKLTVGDGVVFDGCIAYNNADDGWDLFAKVESGCIGQVTIQNSVAFANGYGVDGTDEGNGNGFKMGGSSMSGPHRLINSVAWGNKAKGIDSNSGPDIQVYNCTSFNNGGANVALYTNDAANTDYYVDGVMSYRTSDTSVNENIKAKGTQDTSKIYGTLNFFWNDSVCANSDGLTAADSWFTSLDAPYASVADPYAVADSIRSESGKIDLGDFLKLTDTGIAALSAAGITYTDVVAVLDGNYEALSDQSEITGSTSDDSDTGATDNSDTEATDDATNTATDTSSDSNDQTSDNSNMANSGSEENTNATVEAAPEGTKIKSDNNKYVVLADGTVKLTKFASDKKSEKIRVPATITSDGVTYTVSEIGKAAFKGTKATKVVLGANITTIDSKAFKSSKIKIVFIKSTKLTKSSVKNCLKSSNVKRVSLKGAAKELGKKYKKIFTKKNTGKEVSIVIK
jgi:pectin methylesterase-like acyl-CoA thioesterase